MRNSAPTLLLSAAVAISGSAAAWLRIEGLLPPRFAPALGVTAESSTLGLPPNVPETAAQVQTAGLNSLLGIVAVLTVLGAAIALLSFLSLSLARATERRGELATRAALGATPRMLFAELSREHVQAGMRALLIGAPIAGAIVVTTRVLWPGIAGFEAADAWTLLLFTTAPAVAGPLAAGGVGYLAVVRRRLAGALAVGGRATSSPGEVAFRNVLPVAQIAVSLALLVAAGTLMLNAWPLTSEAARDVRDLRIARVENTNPTVDEIQRLAAVFEKESGGTESVSYGSIGAWVGPGESDRLTAECDNCVYGPLVVPFNVPQMIRHAVAPKYFDTIGVRLVAGRDFTLEDNASAEPVVIVNESFAARNFKRGRVLGRKIEVGALTTRKVYRIIGVVEDIRSRTLGQAEVAGTVYFSALQQQPDRIEIVTNGADTDIATLAGSVGLKAEASVGAAELLGRMLAPVRFLARAMLLLSIAGVFFALHGVHAMLRASVVRRVPEIGIRMALGAEPRSVLRLILRHAAATVVAGAGIGVFIAFGAARGVQVLIPTAILAPLPFLLSLGLLAVAACAGAVAPARRASGVDPLICLRAD